MQNDIYNGVNINRTWQIPMISIDTWNDGFKPIFIWQIKNILRRLREMKIHQRLQSSICYAVWWKWKKVLTHIWRIIKQNWDIFDRTRSMIGLTWFEGQRPLHLAINTIPLYMYNVYCITGHCVTFLRHNLTEEN